MYNSVGRRERETKSKRRRTKAAARKGDDDG